MVLFSRTRTASALRETIRRQLTAPWMSTEARWAGALTTRPAFPPPTEKLVPQNSFLNSNQRFFYFVYLYISHIFRFSYFLSDYREYSKHMITCLLFLYKHWKLTPEQNYIKKAYFTYFKISYFLTCAT